MFDPDADNPYKQTSLPYQPYREHSNPQFYQQQEYVQPFTTQQAGSPHITTARPSHAKPSSRRLSKAEALAFADKCKRWLIAGSFVAFGILAGLVAGHSVGTTSSQATPANQAAPPSNPSPSSPSSGGGFFQQQQPGGSGFGNSNPSQPPVSSSHTS